MNEDFLPSFRVIDILYREYQKNKMCFDVGITLQKNAGNNNVCNLNK